MTAMGLGIAAVVILAIGVGVWVGKMLWSGRGPDEPIQPGLRPEPPAVVQKPGQDVKPRPPRPKPPKPKPPPVPTCVVVAAWNAPFVAAGYTPARRGRHFRKISATVKAGTKPASFKTAGPDVMLRVGVEEFTSLGSPPQGNSLAMRPKIAAVKLKPRKSERLTFVFDLPADLDGTERGILTIRGIEPVDVPPMASRPPARPPEKLTTYVEAPPRNLRPLLRDPVMAAIQAARNQKLFLRRRSEELSISIPAAGVSGTARKLRDGHYQAMLKRGAESLQCLLRLFDRGHRIVLYLADEPFHQITYVHPKWTGETKTHFKPPEPDRPKAPDVPKRHEQPPSTGWPVKKHMPDFDPNQKSIFD